MAMSAPGSDPATPIRDFDLPDGCNKILEGGNLRSMKSGTYALRDSSGVIYILNFENRGTFCSFSARNWTSAGGSSIKEHAFQFEFPNQEAPEGRWFLYTSWSLLGKETIDANKTFLASCNLSLE